MTDLTKITTPFGLLDAETQAAMRAHGGPYEVWRGDNWGACSAPHWGRMTTYRVKPQPPKPRECWVVYTGGDYGLHDPWRGAWPNEADALEQAAGFPTGRVLHMREVLP